MSLMAGIALSSDVLTSSWFILLATVVAFNTIIYVGLTLGRLIPWPQQIHPSRVRTWLVRFGWDADEVAGAPVVPVPRRPESDQPFDDMRLTIARNDIPQALGLAGVLIILLAVVGVFVFGMDMINLRVAEMAVGLAFLGLANLLGHRRLRGRTMMWIWAFACVAVVILLTVETVGRASLLPLIYCLIVLTAFPAATLAWRPTLVAGVLMLSLVTGAVVAIAGDQGARLVAAAVMALMVGAVLLHLRLSAIEALSEERARSGALASTDPLTGQLTRQGLLTLMPGLAANAERLERTVVVMYFDIDNLGRANDDYGIAYGDAVLQAVASAIRDCVRAGDLVSRWSGDEFLVAGIGMRPEPQAFAGRVQAAVAASGVSLGKWPTTVSVGIAAGDPGETTFDHLVTAAVMGATAMHTGRSEP